MLNAAHILETAFLFLVAFLVGCVLGYIARRLTQPGRQTAVVAAAESAPAATAAAPLVTAPDIAPLPARRPRTAAERLAAAAGRDPDPRPVAARDPDVVVPPAAHVATPVAAELASVPLERVTPVADAAILAPIPAAEPVAVSDSAPPAAPVEAPMPVPDAPATEVAAPPPVAEPDPIVIAPPVESEPAPAPVAASDVPPIDEAAHVLDLPPEPSSPSPEPEPVISVVAEPPEPAPVLAQVEPAPVPEPAPVAEPVEPASRTALTDDDESAAMRAIEGGWTPRRRSAPSQRPVPHPEQVSTTQDVDDAMQTARTAVAAAAAAAAAAIAESQERPQRPAADGLNFEQRTEAMAASFLGKPEPEPPADTDPGLDFEPAHPATHHGFGRPEGLPSARDGGADNLKQIKGITPPLETSLNSLGIFHFDQIAAWDQKAVVWLDNHLSLRGRIGREKWQEQARSLSTGRGQPARPLRR